jgi:hypothetical protein
VVQRLGAVRNVEFEPVAVMLAHGGGDHAGRDVGADEA